MNLQSMKIYWYAGKRSLKKWSPKNSPLEKNSRIKNPPKEDPRKNGPWKNGPRKNGLRNFLKFLSIDSTTHTNRCLTYTSRSYMHQTVEH